MTNKTTGTKFKTVKALITDLKMYEKVTGNEKIQIYHCNLPITKWNFNNGPNQCYICLKFGHTYQKCTGVQICLRCGGEHKKENCTRKESDPYTCANCKRAGLKYDHAAVSKCCPAIIDYMSKKSNLAQKIERKYSNIVSNPTIVYKRHPQEIAKLTEANTTNIANVVFLVLEMFKDLNKVQEEMDKPESEYIPQILNHYLGSNIGNIINTQLKKANNKLTNNLYNEDLEKMNHE